MKWEIVNRISAWRRELGDCGATSCFWSQQYLCGTEPNAAIFSISERSQSLLRGHYKKKNHAFQSRNAVRQEITAGGGAQDCKPSFFFSSDGKEDVGVFAYVCVCASVCVYLVREHLSWSGRSCQLQPWCFFFQP